MTTWSGNVLLLQPVHHFHRPQQTSPIQKDSETDRTFHKLGIYDQKQETFHYPFTPIWLTTVHYFNELLKVQLRDVQDVNNVKSQEIAPVKLPTKDFKIDPASHISTYINYHQAPLHHYGYYARKQTINRLITGPAKFPHKTNILVHIFSTANVIAYSYNKNVQSYQVGLLRTKNSRSRYRSKNLISSLKCFFRIFR